MTDDDGTNGDLDGGAGQSHSPEAAVGGPSGHDKVGFGTWLWSAGFRWLTGLACIVIRFTLLTNSGRQPLGLAVLLLGILILVHRVLDKVWGRIYNLTIELSASTYTKGFQQGAAALHPSRPRIATFAGDSDKFLQLFGVVGFGPDAEIVDWSMTIRHMEDQHLRAGLDAGRDIVESGLVKLQGLLWAAKWATNTDRARVDPEALARDLGVL